MFHHFLIFPSPILAGRGEFDPSLFSLETETQQYVLLGITRHSFTSGKFP